MKFNLTAIYMKNLKALGTFYGSESVSKIYTPSLCDLS